MTEKMREPERIAKIGPVEIMGVRRSRAASRYGKGASYVGQHRKLHRAWVVFTERAFVRPLIRPLLGVMVAVLVRRKQP